MSKKRDNVDMDDIQFDDFGDFNEGGFDGQEPKAGSRKPVVTLKGSFVSGVKQGVLDPSNQMAFARKALPKGYSQTLDFADKTTTELKGLYDYAAKEAEPGMTEHYQECWGEKSQTGCNHEISDNLADTYEYDFQGIGVNRNIVLARLQGMPHLRRCPQGQVSQHGSSLLPAVL